MSSSELSEGFEFGVVFGSIFYIAISAADIFLTVEACNSCVNEVSRNFLIWVLRLVSV